MIEKIIAEIERRKAKGERVETLIISPDNTQLIEILNLCSSQNKRLILKYDINLHGEEFVLGL
jgi:hypothetical protein